MEKYVAEKIQACKASVQKRKWAVWAWIALGVLVVGYVVLTMFRASGERMELAKLRHEKDVNEEMEKQLIVDAKVAEIGEEKDKLREQIIARTEKRGKIEEQLKIAEVRKVEADERIDQLKTWADVDSTVVFRSKPRDN